MPTEAAPPSAWTAFRTAITRFEAAKIMPEIAVRNSIGFVAAIAIAMLIRSPSAGVIAGTGALNVSYSDSRDPYSLRARRMLVSALLCGVAVTLGALSGHNNIAAVAVATIWAFASGMLVALGTIAGDLGVITLVTLVVFAARPLSVSEAIQSGFTATGGALLQVLLAIALWPVRRYDPERRIISSLYRSLAGLARSPRPPSGAPPFSQQISDAQDSLVSLGTDHREEAERLYMLLHQAERIRLSLLTLGRLAHRIARYEEGEKAAQAVHRAMNAAGETLDSISRGTACDWHHTESIHAPAAASSFLAALIRDAQQQLDALGGQLRTACGVTSAPGPVSESAEPWRLRFSGRLAKLQANLSLNSTVFRHALRLAVCLGAGDGIGRALKLQRTYWIPMTIAIVLKPDFTTTLTRGVLRILGTLAGLGLATALFYFIHTGPVTDVALLGVCIFLLRWVGPANYGIFVTALSALVVLLFALNGQAPRDVIALRAENTAIGGLLAMVGYALWPTWEKTQVGPALADMLEAYRAYFRAIAARAGIDNVRLNGRRARTNAEASVDRMAGEPGVTADTVRRLQAILVSSHRFAHAAMAIEATLRPVSPPFADAVDRTLQAAAEALRSGSPLAKDVPALRECHDIEMDRVASSLNTMMEQISGRVRSPDRSG